MPLARNATMLFGKPPNGKLPEKFKAPVPSVWFSFNELGPFVAVRFMSTLTPGLHLSPPELNIASFASARKPSFQS